MDLREAEALVDELRRLVESGPGENPAGLQRVSEICWQFRNSERCDPHLAERLLDARKMFECWFSARGWQQWGHDGDGARSILGGDLDKVQRAVSACFGDTPDRGLMA